MDSVIERAFAKINIYLDIVGRMPDGYHDLATIMQIVSLYDLVEIKLNNTKEINLICEGVDIEPKKNLAFKAAELFFENMFEEVTTGVDIVITKNIPVAAGLGGGSADAAAVLRGMNRLYGHHFTTEQLCLIAREIGADVEFNVLGGVYVCRERGKPIINTNGIRYYNLLLVSCGTKESTNLQYQKLDFLYNDFVDYKCCEGYADSIDACMGGRCSDLFKSTKNIFESLYQGNETADLIKEVMYKYNAKLVMLSGSGPTYFGVFPNSLYLEDAEEEFEKLGLKTIACDPINTTYEEIEKGHRLI